MRGTHIQTVREKKNVTDRQAGRLEDRDRQGETKRGTYKQQGKQTRQTDKRANWKTKTDRDTDRDTGRQRKNPDRRTSRQT